MLLLGDKDRNRVLHIAANVDKEYHKETHVRENGGGEKAVFQALFVWGVTIQLTILIGWAILYKLHTLPPPKVSATQNVFKTGQVNMYVT